MSPAGWSQVSNGALARISTMAGALRVSEATIQAMVSEAQAVIESGTPIDKGNLVEWLSRTAIISAGPSVFAVGIGPKSGLDIGKPAPPHTIKNFVEWYKGIYGDGDLSGPHGQQSWKFLTPEQKDMLYLHRRGGNASMGGPLPPPKYFAAVEEGDVPGTQLNIGFFDKIATIVHARVNAMKARVIP